MEYSNSYRHIIIEFENCDPLILKDKKLIILYLREAIKELDLGNDCSSFFMLNPCGITAISILKNIQLTLMTNHSECNATLNIFTTSSYVDSYPAFRYLKKVLKSSNCEIKESLCDSGYTDFPYLKLPIDLRRTSDNSLTSNMVITILGSSGGVSKAILSILNSSINDENDPIHDTITSSKLHLIDIKQKDINYYKDHFPNLSDKISLYEFDLRDCHRFTEHLKSTQTNIVIDLSLADTIDLLRCCNTLGVAYINSAFEVLSVDEDESLAGFSSHERFLVFENHRDEFKNTSAIICSGMNPGVVQWMAIEAMKKNPNKRPNCCYIVEEDTSFLEDSSLADKDTIYTTWCPICFLDEAIYSYPTYMKNHLPLFFYKEVYELEFKVKLGNKEFYGCLMPHEEAITLGKIYDMEIGFLYKVNDHTTNLINDNIDDLNVLWDKPMEVLDPEVSPLIGEDLVGVLIVYDDKEVYMYNCLDNKKTYEKYRVNATYLQVAAGIYGALCTLTLDNIPKEIYYVDELLLNTESKYGKYLSYHLQDFISGENPTSDGTLLNRVRERAKKKVNK